MKTLTKVFNTVKKVSGRKFSLICIIFGRKMFFDNIYSQQILKKPYLNYVGWIVYKNTMSLLTSALSYIKNSRYISDNPFELIWVDPNKINHSIEIDAEDLEAGLRYGRVIEGAWDIQDSYELNELDKYSSIASFIETDNWEGSNMSSSFHNRTNKWCETSEQRKESINELKNSIESGYKSQRFLCEKNLERQIKENNDVLFPQLNEVQVAIGRDGQIFWKNCGLHRLAISKIKDIDKIPVIVRYRHKHWQEKRQTARENPETLSREQKNHPDIKNILNKNEANE